MGLKAAIFAGIAACLISGAALADSRVMAGERAYARGDYVEAVRLFTPPALLGDPTAETYLGFMFQEGKGVPKNYSEAYRWFYAAALQGVPTAQYFVGELYDKGFGAPHDFVQAYLWIDLAAAHAEPRHRVFWARMRDEIANKLTFQELAQAQALAVSFVPLPPPR